MGTVAPGYWHWRRNYILHSNAWSILAMPLRQISEAVQIPRIGDEVETVCTKVLIGLSLIDKVGLQRL